MISIVVLSKYNMFYVVIHYHNSIYDKDKKNYLKYFNIVNRNIKSNNIYSQGMCVGFCYSFTSNQSL